MRAQERQVMNNDYKYLRVGLLGLGLEAYWEQFDGLKARLLGYLAEVEARVTRPSRVVFNLGLVDSAPKGIEAGHSCRRSDIDILLVYVTTYALSATLLPVILRAKVPVIFLNLQPDPAIEYESFNMMPSREAMTGEWLAYCSSCPMPEIANVLTRLDKRFHQVTGTLYGDQGCWEQVEEWLRAAEVGHALSHARLGLMGHYYGGMLDVVTDLVQVSGRFGIHVEMLEVDELTRIRAEVEEDAIQIKLDEFNTFFEVGENCSSAELVRAARTAVALDNFVSRNNLDFMAYFYKGSGLFENEDTMSSVILGSSMLTGLGVPVAGEYEVKNAIAMKIMDLLGAGGSFTEYYVLDFASDLVLMGHDGPGHTGIAEGRIKVQPLEVYHGKVGKGLSVEMSVKQGPITLLSVVEDKNHGFKLLAAEGESVAGEILKIGNTNSRYSFPGGARHFIEQWNSQGPAHHCAVGVGHLAGHLEKLSRLLDLGFFRIP